MVTVGGTEGFLDAIVDHPAPELFGAMLWDAWVFPTRGILLAMLGLSLSPPSAMAHDALEHLVDFSSQVQSQGQSGFAIFDRPPPMLLYSWVHYALVRFSDFNSWF